MLLKGKVAVITGGSRGLGLEMARALAAEGASVVVASRDEDECRRVAAELHEHHGVVVLGTALNVGRWDDCDRLTDVVLERFGQVDVLVNNAGMSPLYDSLEEVSEALFDKVFAVNARGPFRLTARMGAHMARSGGGSIINISSFAAVSPDPMSLPYAAAKAALNTFTEGFAKGLGPHVRVNTIQCGGFRTDIAEHWSPEFESSLVASTALHRIGEPSEIGAAAVYFASDASSYCTGATLRIDGGVR